MKHIHTAVVFDQGDVSKGEGWKESFETYTRVIAEMENPAKSGKFQIRAKSKKLNAQGKPTTQWNRNGVNPIKAQFLERMAAAGWKEERPLSLLSYFEKTRKLAPIITHPHGVNLSEALHSSVGDFDFWYQTPSGCRSVIEWETGNISSSHRSINKLCLALMAGLIDCGVLVVPSDKLYPHLTDRIGNWKELSPYLAFWQTFGQVVTKGLLAITVVEHDELVTDDSIPYLTASNDGRSAEGAAKL